MDAYEVYPDETLADIYDPDMYKFATLVVTAPQENAELERFLGYTWSNRKGSEGLKPNSLPCLHFFSPPPSIL